MHLDNKRFEIYFKQQCLIVNTSKKSDWYILDKNENKVLIGMHQLNMGMKTTTE